MPKTSRKSTIRESVSQDTSINVKTLKLRKIDDEELSQNTPTAPMSIRARTAWLCIIFIAITATGLFIFKEKLPFEASLPEKLTNIINQEPSPSPQSTQEAKLVEVYEKQKGIELKNFSPRYSVFQNADLGYRFAYPVGFGVTPLDNNAQVTPNTGSGKITITVAGGSFKVEVSSTTSQKDLEILNTAADFIRGTFEFNGKTKYSQKDLQERFSGGSGSSGY